MLRSRRIITCNACFSNSLNITKSLATPQIRTITEKGVKRNEYYAEHSRTKPGFFCLGAVMDPYVPEVYKAQAASLFSLTGLSQRFTLIKKFFTRSFSRLNLWRREGDKGKKAQLISNAVDTYKKVKQFQTKKDFQKLNLLCTERVYEQMKKESHDDKKVKWTLHDVVEQQLIHVAARDMKDIARKNKVICQYTVKIVSRQSLTPFNSMNPDAPINPEDIHTVEEYVVMEKDILDITAPWRYAGSIDTSKPYKIPTNAEISGIFGPSAK